MSPLVDIRFGVDATPVRHRQTTGSAPRTSRRVVTRRNPSHRPARAATQRRDHRRPAGVQGPALASGHRVRPQVRPPAAPPVTLETGVRLTDRGLAVAMTLAAVVMIAAMVCITATVLRVTAEPAESPLVAVVAAQ